MQSPIEYHPIGVIRTPFKTPEGTPIQPTGGTDAEAVAEIFPKYRAGLEDLEGFSHLILLYHCHLSAPFRLKVRPFLDNTERGLFATRAPSRPNSIGLSVVRLSRIADHALYIKDVDILDGAPLLDIKPYVPAFDMRQGARSGWFETKAGQTGTIRDDGRFSKK
ncbi:tRNA (N6-threonylcarbamoyladenosine(37)-N6)-meth yltransferase TrmO [Desulfonema ishimotonii]|uniref:tRNA (N6-threonylcarbamoyladenosine(37)-N6)-meth yltransferase TrmO n=1 Tax=Desulfonema ishimotonii TaxID=45657 RepID=A0A401FR12_9BACT|nr:tRNA (N6-threonylcarbamoyladenosine(37)-N6)-methyltransferase TrmO [Desulfonema ishimotonii]GBC59399.1 tRNA (N6-threonylcarbamoyladenosine(37)-N6)-meth yltransferase TrmO [Desulfonema ishimotonii]